MQEIEGGGLFLFAGILCSMKVKNLPVLLVIVKCTGIKTTRITEFACFDWSCIRRH